MTFQIDAVREKFPALALTDKGRRRIYLDNPAGTQVPQAVADAVSRCLLTTNANLGGYLRNHDCRAGRRRRGASGHGRFPRCQEPCRKSSSAPT